MSNTPQRTRITISITNQVAEALDGYVDGIRIRNRSHAVETLLSEALSLNPIEHAIIMAGGERAQQRVPAIIRAIEHLALEGIGSITIALGSHGEQVRQAIEAKTPYRSQLTFIRSEHGTGGALRQLRDTLQRAPFLVINISEAAKTDLSELIRVHRSRRGCVTIASKSLTSLDGYYLCEPDLLSDIPSGFSMLETDVFPELARRGTLVQYPALITL
jgi:hypothetical protein